ncbi:hypothetical protein QBC34DRAFT_57530 [Podospora aff. communis PSN243]|uniref:Prion-inhibition and propagation HeLo domain-containing protein n=1 Tax=Podospora aff. communis PSN243 TaxID=3040156 RepID=A0AAV9GRU8_9PEZI|nr:hypothetical protein QBC34DRAFT_57530 [Podospora aff. communis PSN243]
MAEIALGVVPIFFGAVRGFSLLRDKLHLLRHYRKEVKWLRTKVEVQSLCFKSEVHHIIIDILDTRTAQSLITDDDHTYWKDKDLEGQLRRHMGELHPEFHRALEEVKKALMQIEAKLAVFATPDTTSPIFQATKDKFRLAFRKEEYKEDIAELKEWVAELKRIRKLARAMQKSAVLRGKETEKENSECVVEMEQPFERDLGVVKQYRRLRHLSSSCQSVLERWTCSSSAHSYHGGRLLAGQSPRQDSIFLVLETSGRQDSGTLSTRLLFKVQSQPLGLLTPESLSHASFEDLDGPSPKRKRLSSGCQAPVREQPREMASLCQQLQACSVASCARSLMYVDLQLRERVQFEAKPQEPEVAGDWDMRKPVPLTQLLGCSPHSIILDRERVQLALAVLRATLTNHSTPAWPEGCLLEGIALFQDEKGEINVSSMLNTLNIPVVIGGGDSPDMDMDAESVTVSEEELRFTYGIRNLTLYRLGTAFLSIGLWNAVDWKDVAAVRRKAAALDSLGTKFKDTVERLLYSNFGVDTTDLNDERLQVEILRTVVAPLEQRAKSRR